MDGAADDNASSEDEAIEVLATGPGAPQASVGPPHRTLPVRATDEAAALWIVGAHGGAGESTIASLDPSWQAAGHSWPAPVSGEAACLVVARTSVSGLLAARDALQQWASATAGPAARCVGLLLIADAPGKPPRAITDLAHHVAGGAPRTVRFGWNEAWRLAEPDPTAGRDVRKLIRGINKLVPAPQYPSTTTT